MECAAAFPWVLQRLHRFGGACLLRQVCNARLIRRAFRRPRKESELTMMIRSSLIALALAALAPCAAAAEVNEASLAELQDVRGVGKTLAQRITRERAAHGAFKDWQDLIRRVNGVGPGTARNASDGGLLVRGSTYTPAGHSDGRPGAKPANTGRAPAVAPAGVASKEQASTAVSPPAIGAQAPQVPQAKP
jgi:competence protein ComEA